MQCEHNNLVCNQEMTVMDVVKKLIATILVKFGVDSWDEATLCLMHFYYKRFAITHQHSHFLATSLEIITFFTLFLLNRCKVAFSF